MTSDIRWDVIAGFVLPPIALFAFFYWLSWAARNEVVGLATRRARAVYTLKALGVFYALGSAYMALKHLR